MITVTRRYHFESGHFLPLVKPPHKCAEQHGHNYEMEITVAGHVGQDGFLVDFFDLDAMLAPVLKLVDHKNLNTVPGLENPTVENIVVWMAEKLRRRIPETSNSTITRLMAVRVYETKDCWADWLA